MIDGKEMHMNKTVIMGRLTRDPEVRYSQGEKSTAVARFTLAVDRRFKRDNEPTADFIGCVAFGKTGEFIEKYCRQGTKLCVEGRIQTGSYTNKDGNKVYTTDVVVENAEFAESKAASSKSETSDPKEETTSDSKNETESESESFMDVTDSDIGELFA